MAVVALGAGSFDAYLDRRENVRWAQAGYDYGVKVGKVLGSCDTLRGVAKANPDSEWTANTADARSACDKLESQHAPGTKETLPAGHAK